MADKHIKRSYSSTLTYVKKGSSSISNMQHFTESNGSPPMTERDKEIYRLCLKYDLDDSKKQAIWEKIYGRRDMKVIKPPTSFRKPNLMKSSTVTSIERKITITNLISDMNIQVGRKTDSNSLNADSETLSELERLRIMRVERIPIASIDRWSEMSMTSLPCCEIEEYAQELNKITSNNLHVDKSMQRYVLDLTRFASDQSSHHNHNLKKTRHTSEQQKANASNLPNTNKDVNIQPET